MKKILITGGAGFVGTVLIPQLLEKGYHVRVLDNLTFVGDPILHFLRNENFEFVKGDVRNKDDLKNTMKDRDVIIHLAAIVGYPACRSYPDLAKAINVDATKQITQLASKNQLILFASTGSVYGAVVDTCTEETPLNPLSLYGQTKRLGEQYTMEKGGCAFRFATAFGSSPRLRLDLLVNDFVHKAVTQGYVVVYEKNFMRTFVHVYDMGRAFLLGIEKWDDVRSQVYNVGDDKMNYSKEEVCRMIEDNVKCYFYYAEIGEDSDKRDYYVSYKKFEALGFKTSVNLEKGIRELINAMSIIKVDNPYVNL